MSKPRRTPKPATTSIPKSPEVVWKDETSYSHGSEDRTPREWTLRTGEIRISIHRHQDYSPNVWLVSCPELGMRARPLVEEDVLFAKNEALRYVRSVLQKMVNSIPFGAPDAGIVKP